MTRFGQFARFESGATAIEYAFIASLIAVVIIGGVSIVGTELDAIFMSVGSGI